MALTDMTKFSSNFAAIEAGSAEPQWVQEFRRKGFENFEKIGLPSTEMEDFRFSKLSWLDEHEFVAADPKAEVSESFIKKNSYDGLDKHQLVFVNGEYREDLSSGANLPDGIVSTTLRKAIVENEELVQAYLGRISDADEVAFSALNHALMQDGFVLQVPDNVKTDEIVHILSITTDSEKPSVSSPRNLFVFGKNSHANIVETHVSTSESVYFKNIMTEIFMAEGATGDHYRIQRESLKSHTVTTLRLYEEAESHFRSHTLDFGGATVRNNLYGKLDGDKCDATLNGLYMLRGKQHVDNYMWAEHVKEDIPSHELYKGILDDESSAVFTGRIYVHKEAQRTDAKQTNQNLLLSDDARINTKPQLEIYADDVKCTHGATVGQLDETAMFYLQSRAIDKVAARNLLILAFAAEITEEIQIDSVRETVEKILSGRLLDEQDEVQ